MSENPINLCYPAVLLSAEGGKPYLVSGIRDHEDVTVQFSQYLRRSWLGAVVVDSGGHAFQVTHAELRGINWRLLFSGGVVLGIVVLAVSLITVGVPVRVRFCVRFTTAPDLRSFKSTVLKRIAGSTRNFMGRGDAQDWQAPVNTASTFKQVVGRLSLQ
jgi:hypothetical protein